MNLHLGTAIAYRVAALVTIGMKLERQIMMSQAQHATQSSAQPSSWSVKGVSPAIREAVKEAARQSGMTIGEWLNFAISHQAKEQKIAQARQRSSAHDERWAEIAMHLSRLAQRNNFIGQGGEGLQFNPALADASPALSALGAMVQGHISQDEKRRREQTRHLANVLDGLARYVVSAEEKQQRALRSAELQHEQIINELTGALELVAKRMKRMEKQIEQQLSHLPPHIVKPLQEAATQQAQAIVQMEKRLAQQMLGILDKLQEKKDISSAISDTKQVEIEERLARAIADIRSRQVELARLEAAPEENSSQQVIIERLEVLSRKLDAALLPEKGEQSRQELNEVLTRLDRIDSRLIIDQPQEKLNDIEKALYALSENIEKLNLGNVDSRSGEEAEKNNAVIDDLANQISDVTKRLDELIQCTHGNIIKSDGQQLDHQRLQSLETSITALSAQLRNLPEADSDSLERMARLAVREALTTFPMNADNLSEASQAHQERSTKADDTLDVVHNTLERIVDRLAILEEDLHAHGMRERNIDEPENRAARALAHASVLPGISAMEMEPIEGPEDFLINEKSGLRENIGFTASFIAAARRAAKAGIAETRNHLGSEEDNQQEEDAATSRRRSLVIGVGALIAAMGAAQLSALLVQGAVRLS